MKNQQNYSIEANLVDLYKRKIYAAKIQVQSGLIGRIDLIDFSKNYILPGFIDAHIHIESSMLVPSEFARIATRHGTVATVSDPHEIANVLGVEGVEFMLENARNVPFKFYFGAPSCVPATSFETAGAELGARDVERLLKHPEINYLSEMMNWPGVLDKDPGVMAKINAAKKLGLPVDGHAPGLTGVDAIKYINAGITTDHECVSYDEALHKILNGMKIAIREGSAARNYDALHPLIANYHEKLMFCSDDKHPDELITGHINELVVRSIRHGYDLFDVLRIACLHPIEHYKLHVGTLKIGDPADFIMVSDLVNFDVLETFIDGHQVGKQGISNIPFIPFETPNQFSVNQISARSLEVEAKGSRIRVIEAVDGKLITKEMQAPSTIENGLAVSSVENDVLKLVVVNRYKNSKPSVAFIKNFGLKSGAIASSVGHDCHNVIAVGVGDEEISKAINLIIDKRGGISATGFGEYLLLPLPVAGLMSDKDGDFVSNAYTNIDLFAKKLGSTLRAPFMTLSFMALLVIPDLKLSDKGLFSGNKFEFVDLFVD